jgi:hypothetical protein
LRKLFGKSRGHFWVVHPINLAAVIALGSRSRSGRDVSGFQYAVTFALLE